MNTPSAKRVVLLALVTTATVATVKAARSNEKPRAGIYIGTMVAAILLTALAEPAPDIAAGLAALTVFGALGASPETLTTAAAAVNVRRTATTTKARATASSSTTGTTTTADTTGPNTPGNPPSLVSIGQGTHRLAPAAAAAFKTAEMLYGSTIYVTDSYRSYDQQSVAYAGDPNRFGSPQTSWHVKGLAIDVHTKRMNLDDPRLVSALTRSGWCQSALPKEPWHFSYNGCG